MPRTRRVPQPLTVSVVLPDDQSTREQGWTEEERDAAAAAVLLTIYRVLGGPPAAEDPLSAPATNPKAA